MAGAVCLQHCSLSGPEGSCITAGSALLGQPQEEMGILEETGIFGLAGLCSATALQGREQRACGVFSSSNRDGQTWLTPQRWSDSREPWGSSTMVGCEGLQTCLLTGSSLWSRGHPHSHCHVTQLSPAHRKGTSTETALQVGWALPLQQLPAWLRRCL